MEKVCKMDRGFNGKPPDGQRQSNLKNKVNKVTVDDNPKYKIIMHVSH